MTIEADSDLFQAILSMDSYNRGYNEGIVLESGSAVVGTYLGAAHIISQSNIQTGSDAVNAGFYSLAYQLPDTSVTIAYRGTDEGLDPLTSKDVQFAYGVGAGYADTSQSELAFEFYNSVAAAAVSSATIELTGHLMRGRPVSQSQAVQNESGHPNE